MEWLESECIIVGAGAIGLAIARRLAMDGRDVVVLERAKAIGTETSARSNEVIHAGLYHRPGGPQAVLCARGREALYDYCAQHSVAHAQIGKLVVATDQESVGWLEDTHARALCNEVPGLTMLTARDAAQMEPNLRCVAALHSARTGIVDTHGLMLAYRGDVEAHGGAIAVHSAFAAASVASGGFDVQVTSRTNDMTQVRCRFLINAAGIWAPEVARSVEGMSSERVPRIHLAKGAFFALRGSAPFSHLIVPEPSSWRRGGIFTLDLAQRGRFGPDEAWVDAVDYNLEGWPVDPIYAIVRRYFPGLPDDSLTLDYAGIRPRLNGPGEPPADWLFQSEAQHGMHGLINLFGFESPGITASLAIADVVAGLLEGDQPPFDFRATGSGQPAVNDARRIGPGDE